MTIRNYYLHCDKFVANRPSVCHCQIHPCLRMFIYSDYFAIFSNLRFSHAMTNNICVNKNFASFLLRSFLLLLLLVYCFRPNEHEHLNINNNKKIDAFASIIYLLFKYKHFVSNITMPKGKQNAPEILCCVHHAHSRHFSFFPFSF